MRTIKIENCSYSLYNDIANAIIEIEPFALFQDSYRSELKIATFSFWDSDYIPAKLDKFILRPPNTHENVLLLQKKILEAFEKDGMVL